jgi:hypothetical protein
LVTTCVGLDVSSTIFMTTCRPSSPPLALTVLAHNSYPALTALPLSAKSPVSDTDAPITIGVVEAGFGLLVFDVHAVSATTVTDKASVARTARRKRLFLDMTHSSVAKALEIPELAEALDQSCDG